MEDCCGDEKTPAQKFLICWARLLRLSGRSFENLGLVFFEGGEREEKKRLTLTLLRRLRGGLHPRIRECCWSARVPSPVVHRRFAYPRVGS